MLPETGSISMSQVNVELKKSETAVITLNDTDVRKLAGKPSGVISMNDLRGKKNSEYVENYQIYHNEWSGRRQTGSFSFSFPHKVISGYIIVELHRKAYHQYTGHVIINGVKIDDSNIKNINVNPETVSMTGEYFTGEGQTSNGNVANGVVDCNIKFTGEWEAQRR